MQKTIAQQRAEMKAKLAANLKAEQTIEEGKTFREGRYEFKVSFFDGHKAEIYCHFDGELKRIVRFFVEDEYFVANSPRKMSKALLKALCIAFLSWTTTGAKDGAELNAKRGSAYRRSFCFDRWGEDCLFDNPFAPKGVVRYDI